MTFFETNKTYSKSFNTNNVTFLQWGQCGINRPYSDFPGDSEEDGKSWLLVSFVGGSTHLVFGEEADSLRANLTGAE